MAGRLAGAQAAAPLAGGSLAGVVVAVGVLLSRDEVIRQVHILREDTSQRRHTISIEAG